MHSLKVFLLAPLFAFPLVSTDAFGGACYSGANCRGRALYRFGDEGTTPEMCIGHGGASVFSDTAKHCYSVGYAPEVTRAPRREAPPCTPTGICTESFCTCCTLPVPRIPFGELCH